MAGVTGSICTPRILFCGSEGENNPDDDDDDIRMLSVWN